MEGRGHLFLVLECLLCWISLASRLDKQPCNGEPLKFFTIPECQRQGYTPTPPLTQPPPHVCRNSCEDSEPRQQVFVMKSTFLQNLWGFRRKHYTWLWNGRLFGWLTETGLEVFRLSLCWRLNLWKLNIFFGLLSSFLPVAYCYCYYYKLLVQRHPVNVMVAWAYVYRSLLQSLHYTGYYRWAPQICFLKFS